VRIVRTEISGIIAAGGIFRKYFYFFEFAGKQLHLAAALHKDMETTKIINVFIIIRNSFLFFGLINQLLPD
jgi:hypothetical protein